MFRSFRSRARPPEAEHVEEVEDVGSAIAVGVAVGSAPGAQDDEKVPDANRVVAVQIGRTDKILVDCIFRGNMAVNNSGGLAASGPFEGSSPILINCVFFDNSAASP